MVSLQVIRRWLYKVPSNYLPISSHRSVRTKNNCKLGPIHRNIQDTHSLINFTTNSSYYSTRPIDHRYSLSPQYKLYSSKPSDSAFQRSYVHSICSPDAVWNCPLMLNRWPAINCSWALSMRSNLNRCPCSLASCFSRISARCVNSVHLSCGRSVTCVYDSLTVSRIMLDVIVEKQILVAMVAETPKQSSRAQRKSKPISIDT